MVRIKRAYDPAAASDGYRVLVDRLWPRGLKKDAAAIDVWCKEIAPSDELRRWFAHEPSRFRAFRRRYARELEGEAAREELDALARRAKRATVTLVYGARDTEHNNAIVLADALARRKPARRGRGH